MGYAWLNLASLLLGLTAWGTGLAAVVSKRAAKRRLFLPISMGTCILALLSTMFYTGHLVDKGDWSALMDTMGASNLAATVLVAVTLLLNIAAALRKEA